MRHDSTGITWSPEAWQLFSGGKAPMRKVQYPFQRFIVQGIKAKRTARLTSFHLSVQTYSMGSLV